MPLDSINPSPFGLALAGTHPYYLQGATLAAAAKRLGMSGADLQNQLKTGTRLTDLASRKGVPMEALRSAIQQAIGQNPPAAPTSRRSDGGALAGGRLVDLDA